MVSTNRWDPKNGDFSLTVLFSTLDEIGASEQPGPESYTKMMRAQGVLSTILQAADQDDDKSREQLLYYWSYVADATQTTTNKTMLANMQCGFPDPTMLTQQQTLEAEKWMTRVQTYARSRRVFRTARGVWGTGPSVMRANDIVVVVYGSDVPLVLRRNHEKWQLVGTCYLHGYMQGRAVEDFQTGKLEMQDFEVE